MAQHDYNLANQSGADFRADLNNALSAIATVNSGASEPSTTFAHQLWVDTSNNLLKIRNAANSAFITTGISITADNVFTGALTGNASTATTLETARTINGTSFDGSANISFNTDSVSEGSSNLYFTSERVDDQVNTLLQAGTGIQLTYDDTAGTLTIANTNDADITGVVAGNGLTGGGTSGSVTLNVAVDDSSIEIDSDALRVKASGITNTMLAGSIANSKLANSSVTINSQSLSLGGTLVLDTDNIGEGSSNLYYTDARARAAISENSAQLSYNSTTGVLTYTQGDTDTVSEGSSNLYYTQARFDTAFGNKTTADLTENTNLYYTDARANSAIDARVTNTFINNLSGVVADTSTALATARTIALSGDVVGSVSFDGTADVTIASTIQANSVALGTDTTGNYVQTITGTANKITVSGSGSESADITLTLPDDVQIASDLTVAGNLTVNGTLTSLDTTNLDIEDNLFQLNAGLTGSPVNDSGMLINRGNQNNGIFMWDESVDKFTLGLTTADGTSTGNITLASLGTLVANVEGNVTGTIQTAAQPNITSLGTLTGLTTTGDINFGDNDKAVFGAGSDLEIYHDGSNSFIKDSGTGSLLIDASNLYLRNSSGEEYASFIADGAANLKYNGSTRIVTTSTGVNVTGNVTFDDNGYAIFGASNDLQIYHDGSNSYIRDIGTGNLNILADELKIMNAAGTENKAFFVSDGGAYLYHNNSAKLETTSTGIDVTGTATMDGLTVESTLPTITLSETDDSTYSTIAQSFGYLQISADAGNTGSGDGIVFKVDNSEAARIDSSGNLGLGTTSPTGDGTALHIHGSTHSTLHLTNSTTGSAVSNGFDIITDGSDALLRNREDAAIKFRIGSSEVLRMNSTGVGISTTSPRGTLDLGSGSGDGTLSNTPSDYQLILEAAQSTTGDIGRNIAFVNGTNNVSASINSYDAGTGVTNGLVFATAASGTLAERMRLDSSGQLFLGTATVATANTAGDDFVIKGSGTSVGMTIAQDNPNGTGSIFFGDTISSSAGSIRYNHNTGDMALNAEDNLNISADAVGIGTTSPTSKLHVYGGATGSGIDVATFKSATGAFNIKCSDLSAANPTWTLRTFSGEPLAFGQGTDERMRLDSSGNFMVGKTSVGVSTTGSEIRSNGQVSIVREGDTPLFINRKTDDGTVIDLRKDGSTVGAINTVSGDLAILSTASGHKGLRFGSGAITPTTNTAAIDNGNTDLGGNSIRFKDLYLSGTANTGGLSVNASAFGGIQLQSGGSDCGYLGVNTDTVYVGAGSNLIFHTGNAGLTNGSERMRIDSSGNVGIGGSPSSRLETVGGDGITISNSGDTFLQLKTTGTTATNYIEFKDSGGSAGSISYNHTDNYLATKVNGSERMRIDGTGKVGIGTSSGTGSLHVTTKDSNGSDVYYVAQNTTSNRLAGYKIFDESGNVGGVFQYDNGGNSLNIGTAINTHFSFNTNNTERMRITSTGVINSPPTYAQTTSNSANMVVRSNGDFERSTSSERYKNSITNATKGLAELKTLRPVNYKGNNDGDTIFYGLIAEEVHDAGLTEFVEYDNENKPDALRYPHMVSLCVKAIQEQQTQIEELKQQIQNLTGE